MSALNLELVKKLAEQLSPENRILLYHHLANLPDSEIHIDSLSEPPYLIQVDGERQETLEITDSFVLISSPPGVSPMYVAALLKDKPVFQVFYFPENFIEGRLEERARQHAPITENIKKGIHSSQHDLITENIKKGIRSLFAEHGVERTEEEIIEVAKQYIREFDEEETFHINNEIAARLRAMTGLLVDATIRIIEISIFNSDAKQTGQLDQKIKLEDMEKILEPYWRHIKDKQLGVTQGGARPRKSKFVWDAEKALKFYQTVEALPSYGADKTPMWSYARNLLSTP